MTTKLTYLLPADSLLVEPVVQVTESVQSKEYIVTFSFKGNSRPITGSDETPEGLHWSERLRKPFAYVPATNTKQALRATITRLPKFVTPRGTDRIGMSVRAWSATVAHVPLPFDKIVLETAILGQSALIFPEEDVEL